MLFAPTFVKKPSLYHSSGDISAFLAKIHLFVFVFPFFIFILERALSA